MGPIRWWSSNKKIFKQFNWKVFWAANFESIEIELAGRGGGSSQTSNYFLIDRIDAALRCPAIYHFLGARVVQLTKLSKEVNQWIPHSLDSLCIPRVINTLSVNFSSMPKVLKRRAWVSEERHVLARGRKSPIWDIYAPAHRRPNRHSRDSQTSLLFQYK